MTFFKKASLCAAVALAFAGSVQASPVNVGGVIWDTSYIPDDFLNPAVSSTSATIRQDIDSTTGVLSGAGVVTVLNGQGMNVFCPGCTLTFTYGGFTPVYAAKLPTAISGTSYDYAGGWVNFYVQKSGVTDPYNPSSANLAHAGEGTLWLSLAGHSISANGVTFNGTVFGSSQSGWILNGGGYLDVVGGLAAYNFDTNTQVDGSDFKLSTSFTTVSKNLLSATGTASLTGASIPEPASIALLGLGLFGAGVVRRRKAA